MRHCCLRDVATVGLHVPTGEVVDFPTNTSDALTRGTRLRLLVLLSAGFMHVRQHCSATPVCIMTGGASWKMAPSMSVPFELADSLIFDGLLEIVKARLEKA